MCLCFMDLYMYIYLHIYFNIQEWNFCLDLIFAGVDSETHVQDFEKICKHLSAPSMYATRLLEFSPLVSRLVLYCKNKNLFWITSYRRWNTHCILTI